MSRFINCFKSKLMLTRLVEELSQQNDYLRDKLGRKDRELQRSQTDHRLTQSFYKQVVDNMHEQIAERDAEIASLKDRLEQFEDSAIEYTLPNGIAFKAELYKDDQRMSIDVYSIDHNGASSPVCSVEYEYEDPSEFAKHDGFYTRIIAYDTISEEPTFIGKYNTDDLDLNSELDPETEMDYIDKVMQDRADRADTGRPEHLLNDSF